MITIELFGVPRPRAGTPLVRPGSGKGRWLRVLRLGDDLPEDGSILSDGQTDRVIAHIGCDRARDSAGDVLLLAQPIDRVRYHRCRNLIDETFAAGIVANETTQAYVTDAFADLLLPEQPADGLTAFSVCPYPASPSARSIVCRRTEAELG